MKYSIRWKMKGTRLNYLIFQLAVRGHGIKESGFGLLPTLTKSDSHWGGVITEKIIKQVYLTKNNTVRKKAKKGSSNMGLTRTLKLLPTLTTRDYKTPHGKNSETFKARQNHPRGVNLVEQLQRDGYKGKLNPNWAEWYMGYPQNWTKIE